MIFSIKIEELTGGFLAELRVETGAGNVVTGGRIILKTKKEAESFISKEVAKYFSIVEDV